MNTTVMDMKNLKVQEVTGHVAKKKKKSSTADETTFLSAIQLIQHQLSSKGTKESSESQSKSASDPRIVHETVKNQRKAHIPENRMSVKLSKEQSESSSKKTLEQRIVQDAVKNQSNEQALKNQMNAKSSETINHVSDQGNASMNRSGDAGLPYVQTTKDTVTTQITNQMHKTMTSVHSQNEQQEVKIQLGQVQQSAHSSMTDALVNQKNDTQQNKNIINQPIKARVEVLRQQTWGSDQKAVEQGYDRQAFKKSMHSSLSVLPDPHSSTDTTKQKNDGAHQKVLDATITQSQSQSEHLRSVTGVMNKLELWSSYQSGKVQEKQTPVHQQVSDQLSEWLGKSSLKLEKGDSEVYTLSLRPENLGKLTISVSRGDQGLVAQITAETKAAKDLLESGLNQLKHDCAGKGISFTQIDVTRQLQTATPEHAQSQSQQQGEFQQHQGRQDQQEQEHQQKKHQVLQAVSNDDLQSNYSFSEWMTGGMI
ncbi:flagellar hook-length control protein FliK [Sporolactobacillus kofuensis]|uniref:Flagellar hook-length control protein FliK n=1 Tax=Sporolactobacillus kofuensis TaxID=269672 RepID=A0ABW1WD26_9BACL|nr:flagellar hook-length control protein FliK [Sporolactobacillus kofuensis]